jgi:hypothetical protein
MREPRTGGDPPARSRRAGQRSLRRPALIKVSYTCGARQTGGDRGLGSIESHDGTRLRDVPAGPFLMGTTDAEEMIRIYGWRLDRFHEARLQHGVDLDAYWAVAA